MREDVKRMHCTRRFAAIVAVLALATNPIRAADPEASTASSPLLFETEIQPILKAKCLDCHNAETRESELDLSSAASLLKGGESGPAVVAEKTNESPLYEKIHKRLMPPEGSDPLTDDEIARIETWITSGAKFQNHDPRVRALTEHDVLPILALHCTVCHGLRRREADLDLRTRESLLKGGKSGPAIVLGKPDESLLIKKLLEGAMPPPRLVVSVSVKPVEPTELETLRNWIAQGAPVSGEQPADPDPASDPQVSAEDRTFWSFQTPVAAVPPMVAEQGILQNPIDAFVAQRLESAGLEFAGEADRVALIRRLTYDLTGLPPTPDDLAEFVADEAPDAYERLVDRLLASPHYGERYGRYWLDLAGYADSEGIQHADPVRPEAYRYRDYVIRALNADKPYDRFLHEQLAGDELADYEHAPVITDEIYDNLVATGFLRMAPDGTFAPITGFVPDRLKVVTHEVEILGSAVLGLTFKCARCHTHKFDPIPQRDYYRLTAIFKGAFDENDWLKPQRQEGVPGEKDRFLKYVTTAERQAWEAREAELSAKIDQLQKDFDAKKGSLKDDALKQATDEFDKQMAALKAQRQPEPVIRALWDRGEPSPTYVLRRGEYRLPGNLVTPGVPSALNWDASAFQIEEPWPGAQKTGRRLAFARWLTHPRHPLTARVAVNRVWKEHFGRGIVSSIDDFGKTGAKPTHPELLDWLAVDFIRNGWSVKSLHRTMLTSHAYRQSSLPSAHALRLDPDNLLYSRRPLRRLDAEAVRDALLAVADELDLKPYGLPEGVKIREDGLVTSEGSGAGWRRSVYVQQRRTQIPTLLEDFDLPAMNPNCVARSESIVSPQALHLMNNAFVHELAGRFAGRLQREAGDDPAAVVTRAYELVYSRAPSDEDAIAARDAIDQLTIKWKEELSKPNAQQPVDPSTVDGAARERAVANFCHALLNSAEFLYVD